ncbi:MAG: dihydrofolate reductase [Gemmatimonadetes bacterium]|nr:MAG: dihydrofolate reductase [Gemmatimonadota bacterium]
MIPQEKTIIAAMTADRVIGKDGTIPWHIPEDLKLFKRLTLNNTVIMGRRTFESIGNPLPQRHNIVVSQSLSPQEHFDIVPNISEAIALAEQHLKPIFFIGGACIYDEALPLVDRLVISWIKGKFEGDTYFPEVDFTEWVVQGRRMYDQFEHVMYRRRTAADSKNPLNQKRT